MTLRSLLLATLFAVLTAVSAMLIIPLPIVPITLQVAVMLSSGLLLGWRGGAAAQAFYMLLGLIGLPVFAGGCGGLHHVFDPTFGFTLGFIPAAAVTGFLGDYAAKMPRYKFAGYLASCVAGLVVLYAVGLPALFLNLRYVAEMDVGAARVFQIGLVPFVIPDFIKACLASAIAVRCKGKL